MFPLQNLVNAIPIFTANDPAATTIVEVLLIILSPVLAPTCHAAKINNMVPLNRQAPFNAEIATVFPISTIFFEVLDISASVACPAL